MKSPVNWYNGLLQRKPLATKSVSCMAIFTLGDILSQTFEKKLSKTQKFDWQRSARVGMYGGVFAGPSLHFYYSYILPYLIPGSSMKSIVKKICFDQTVGVSIMISMFYTVQTLLNKGTFTDVRNNIAANYWTTLKTNWMFWPPLMFLNFTFVPIQFQVLFVNVFGVAWNGYLSFVQYSNK